MNAYLCLLNGMILLILLTAPITTAEIPDRLDTILNRGSILIAIDIQSGPYASLVPHVQRSSDYRCPEDCYTENQLMGFDIDVTKAIAQKLGVRPCYISPSFEEITTGNWSDWDIYTGYYITNDRLKDYYFTKPVISDSSRFYIRTDETDITGPFSLSGKIIGVANVSAQLRYLNNELDLPGIVNENTVIDPVINTYPDEYDALDALIAGDVDAVLISEFTGIDAIANGSPIVGLDPFAFTGYSGLALLKKSYGDAESLVLKLDEIITQMHADGELSAISQTYLKEDVTLDSASFNVSTAGQFSG